MTSPADNHSRALAEAAWLHLVNRHTLAETLSPTGDPQDPTAVSTALTRLAGPTGPAKPEHQPPDTIPTPTPPATGDGLDPTHAPTTGAAQ